MRNLKRALSLALASVMLLGMMVVGTSASYPDVDAQDNLEAIEVMEMIGVMGGDDQGNFNPDQYVTRNEMAVIMSHVLNLNVGGTSPFTDVPAWAEPFVAACYANGVVAGTSATTYGGSNKVTAAQAALMVMKALGYFGFAGEFGDDWQLATVKMAAKIELFEDINAAVTAPLTRNEVAQLVLNALEKDVKIVSEIGGMEVDGNGITVSVKPSYDYTVSAPSSVSYNNVNDNEQQLAEKLFGAKLKKNTSAGIKDAFGRPSAEWTYGGKSVLAPDSAAVIYTDEVSCKTIYNDLVLMAPEMAPKFTNSKTADVALVDLDKDQTAADTKLGGKGVQIEVYKDEDALGNVTVQIVEVTTNAGEVTKVVEAKGDDAAYVLIAGKKFETSAFAKDDVVLYTMADGEIQSAKLANKVSEVEISKVTVGKNFVAEGTTYDYTKYATKLTKENVGNTMNLFLTDDGYVIYSKVVTATSDYGYVVDTGSDTGRYGVVSYWAKLLKADATIEEVELDAKAIAKKALADEGNTDPTDAQIDAKKSAAVTALEGDIVEYSKNSDNIYTLTTKGDATTGTVEVNKGKSAMTLGTTFYANSKTLFLVQSGDKYAAYTGYANVTSLKKDEATDIAVFAENQLAKVVFVKDADIENEIKDVIYIVDGSAKEIKDTDAGVYYEYAAVVNGEITTINVRIGATKGVLNSGVVFDDKGIAKELKAYETNTTKDSYVIYNENVTAVAADDVIGINGIRYALNENVEVYKVSADKVEAADLTDLVIAAPGVTASNVSFVVTNGEVVSIFWNAPA